MRAKNFGILMLISIVMACFVGCQNTAGTGVTNPTEEPTVKDEFALESGDIELTVWAEESNFEVLNQMIESFKAEYSGQANFTITLVAQGDSNAKDAFLGDVHAGGDVFSFPDDQFDGLMAAGALVAMPDQDMIHNDYKADAVEAVSYNGVAYGIPYTADNGYFLYYDKRVLSEQDVATMDGLLAACEAANKKFSMDFSSGWYMYSFFGLTGLEFGINEDGVTNHCNWNATDTSIKGTDVGEAMFALVQHPAFAAQGDGDFVEGAQNGTVAAGISGTWNAVAIKEAWGENYGAVKLPTYTVAGKQVQMASFKGFKMMGVSQYSKHKGWAVKLCEWLTNGENQTLRLEAMNVGPAHIAASESDAVMAVPAIYAIGQQAEYATLQRVGGKYWGACSSFANILIDGNSAGTPMQELMDNLVAGITASTAQ